MTDDTTLTARERLRIHLREARRTTDSPIVEAQLDAALDAWDDLPLTPCESAPSVGRSGCLNEYNNAGVCGTIGDFNFCQNSL